MQTVDGESRTKVKKDRWTAVEGWDTHDVHQDFFLLVHKSLGIRALERACLSGGQEVTVVAPEISLGADDNNFIRIGPSGVTIVGTVVNINSGGQRLSGIAGVPDPLADATASLAQISQALVRGGAAATANGAPAAAATAGSMAAALNSANVGFTATWAAASVVPGGQPAANIAYTEGIRAAAAAAASAVMASMAGLSDMHTCPIPVPTTHGPGFVTRGSSTVNIGNLPAARQRDRVFEACGGADPIAMGCMTVNIGDGGVSGAVGLARGASTPATAVGLQANGSIYFGPYIVIVGSAEPIEQLLLSPHQELALPVLTGTPKTP